MRVPRSFERGGRQSLPGPPSVEAPSDRRRVSAGAGVLLSLSLGIVLLVAAAGFAAASWRGRSSVPLDDQLPYLLGVGADDSSTPSEPGGSTDTRDGSSGSTNADGNAASTGVPNAESTTSPGAATPLDSVGPGHEARPGPSTDRVVVHVSGAVVEPGVVELAAGTRVHHAVTAAGGVTSAADLERVNLAAVLVDGERLHVPEIGGDEPPTVVAPLRSAEPSLTNGPAEQERDIRVDINRATVTELQELPGVGPSIARAILDLRTARGAYASVDELLLVDGIGPAKLEALRPYAFVTGT